jgi:3'(2'), 5'-bisphosphate nucleotidase
MFFAEEDIEKIVIIAKEAGEVAKKYFFSRDFEVQKKLDNSSVTDADIAVSKFIWDSLSRDFPKIPIVCEENNISKIDGDVFWLIDPIDGTNSFVDGSGEFAINIALVKDKKAIFGLIYAPVFEGGQMVFMDQKNQVIFIDPKSNRKILNPKKSDNKIFRILVSPRAKQGDIDAFIAQFFPNLVSEIQIIRVSSAVKFIFMLEGKADFYLHLRPSMEWDTASGQALIEALGGEVKNLFFNLEKSLIGENVTYKKLNFSNQPFIAKIYG